MKTLQDILKQPPVFLHQWAGKIDLIADFEDIYMDSKEYQAETSPYPNEKSWREKKAKLSKAIEKYKDVNILFASYGQDNYSGDAFVLFEQNGKLYEVNGSHCSCYGLEGQFSPEEVVLVELENRLQGDRFGRDNWSGNEFADELKKFLDII